MTDLEERARSAGSALRDWTPDGSAPSPEAAVRRAVHRTRAHRAAAGVLLVAVLGGAGLAWEQSRDGSDVEIGPATTIDGTTPTTDAPEPTPTSTPTTAEPDPGTGTGSAEQAATTTPTTATPTTTEAPPEPVSTSCTGQVAGTSITFTVTPPAGWHHNEAALGEPACHHFGPTPIELRPVETESGVGVASNSAVHMFVSQRSDGSPTSFEDWVTTKSGYSNVTDTRRTTVDGHPAARFEELTGPGDDVPQGGEQLVHWLVDLGDVWFDAITTTESGLSYEQSATAIDQIVGSLDFSA